MSAIDLQLRLKELQAERLLAAGERLAADSASLGDLDDEVVAAYIDAAVTHIATLRAGPFGPEVG